ncbi:MAG: hypothetical protein H0W02_18260, partial [Ktedonobacteraceae bacterium]|nr:hypothetical protein [Ktedonobacteraceae bacterium]
MPKRSVFMIIFTCLMALALVACGSDTGSSATPTATTPASTTGPISGSTPTAATVPIHIASITTTVSPSSFSGITCGSRVNFVFTSTVTVNAGQSGGTMSYIWNIINKSTSGNITFKAGDTSKTIQYTFSNVMVAPDSASYVHGSLSVTNAGSTMTSSQATPSGTCKHNTAAFHITSIGLSVSPSSIAGRACNTSITLTYTATFHIVANSPGGTIHFMWTTNNGRGSTEASVLVGAGVTLRTYTWSVTGTLYPDHTFPGNGIVLSTSPNNITSPGAAPSGS